MTDYNYYYHHHPKKKTKNDHDDSPDVSICPTKKTTTTANSTSSQGKKKQEEEQNEDKECSVFNKNDISSLSQTMKRLLTIQPPPPFHDENNDDDDDDDENHNNNANNTSNDDSENDSDSDDDDDDGHGSSNGRRPTEDETGDEDDDEDDDHDDDFGTITTTTTTSTVLHQAIISGASWRIPMLVLQLGRKSLYAVDEIGRTPLMLACSSSSSSSPDQQHDATTMNADRVVDSLLALMDHLDDNDSNDCDVPSKQEVIKEQQARKTAYVNAQDDRGRTALQYALDSSSPSVAARSVFKLLEVSADPFVGDRSGVIILHGLLQGLCSENHSVTMEAIRKLINDHGCDPAATNEKGQTALHILAIHCRDNVIFCTFVNVLMRKIINDPSIRGEYVNAKDVDGKSAILYATMHPCIPLRRVWKLFDVMGGGMVIDVDDHHHHPLRHLLVDDPTGPIILHEVLRGLSFHGLRKILGMVTKLFEFGCDPLATNERGQTTLHVFIMYCWQCHFNFDTRSKDDNFVDVLMRYIDKLKRGSYINRKDIKGNSAILYAMTSRRPLHKILLKILDVTTEPIFAAEDPSDGCRLLTTFFTRGSKCAEYPKKGVDQEILKRLLQLGCDPNWKEPKSGQTALHTLVLDKKKSNGILHAKSDFVDILLQYGAADPTIVDNRGYLPVHYLGNHSHHPPQNDDEGDDDDVIFDPTTVFLLLRQMGNAGFW